MTYTADGKVSVHTQRYRQCTTQATARDAAVPPQSRRQLLGRQTALQSRVSRSSWDQCHQSWTIRRRLLSRRALQVLGDDCRSVLFKDSASPVATRTSTGCVVSVSAITCNKRQYYHINLQLESNSILATVKLVVNGGLLSGGLLSGWPFVQGWHFLWPFVRWPFVRDSYLSRFLRL